MTVPPIPMPEVLDPERPASDASGDSPAAADEQGDARSKALQATCTYGQRLWHTLDAMRAYLVSSLPPDTEGIDAGALPRGAAAPTGPDDDEGWARWQEAYSAVTSLLTGPHGDSGFGHNEAQRLAQARRSTGETAPASGPDQPLPAAAVDKTVDEPGPARQPAASPEEHHRGVDPDHPRRNAPAPISSPVERSVPLVAAVLLGFAGGRLFRRRRPS